MQRHSILQIALPGAMICAKKVQILQSALTRLPNSIPMRKTSLILIAILLCAVSHAQLRVAIVGGAHQATVTEENDLPDWPQIEGNYSGRIGVHGGFLADLRFSKKSPLYFQPAVLFHQRGRKYAQLDPSSSSITSVKATQYINYIDIPLNLVLKVGGENTKFIIGGGPYGSFFFNGKETRQEFTSTGIVTDEKNEDLAVGKKPGQYRVLNYGANALVGVEIGRVFVTANYSRGLNDFFESNTYQGSFKHQIIGGSLGIYLGSNGKPPKKPADQDQDGIPDETDRCPLQAGTALTNGCPDRDGDGIPDREDSCPSQAGTKANKGCPDRDGDGVIDKQDKCPDEKGTTKYGGCPVPDTDGDGFNNETDRCPEVAGTQKYQGCPVPDTDGDGLNDDEDKCPATKGVKENHGCPEVKQELVEQVNHAAKRIEFQSGKAILRTTSYEMLDDVVTLLNTNPSLTLTVEGHTSSEGSYDFNMKLSEDRANSVAAYLISKGIDKNRIIIKGYGPTQLLKEEKTAADRAANRRVELKLSN